MDKANNLPSPDDPRMVANPQTMMVARMDPHKQKKQQQMMQSGAPLTSISAGNASTASALGAKQNNPNIGDMLLKLFKGKMKSFSYPTSRHTVKQRLTGLKVLQNSEFPDVGACCFVCGGTEHKTKDCFLVRNNVEPELWNDYRDSVAK